MRILPLCCVALLVLSQVSAAHTSLMLHDFQHLTSPLPGVSMGSWSAEPGLASGRLFYRLVTLEDADKRRALYMRYQFPPAATAPVGWQLRLPNLDLSAYDHVELSLRGDAHSGFADALKVEFKQPLPGAPANLLRKGSTVIGGITDQWQTWRIPLDHMTGIQDWTQVQQFSLVWEPRRSPTLQGAYWLGSVALVQSAEPRRSVHERVIPPKKSAWEQAVGGKEALQAQLHTRLHAWPQRLTVNASELPSDDRAFLERLAADTWRGLRAFSDREHALPLDTVRLHGSIEPRRAWLGDYTNVTNIGLYLINVVAARELGFISADAAQQQVAHTLASLERLETWQGFFFNYYDTSTLERSSNFVSFVDSAWLSAGLMVVRNAIPELAARCTRILERENYQVFYDPVEQQMMHGYYVHLPHRAEYNYGLLYSEARLGSLIAIGKGQVPEEHWYRMARTFPRDFGWPLQSPKQRTLQTVNGHTFAGGYYSWKGMNYVPSWGGSMFEALMPLLVLDELRHAPHSLGCNAQAHTALQRRFALEHLGYAVWGMSPSSQPEGGYGEFGARVLGVRGYPSAVVTPHAAALALLVDAPAALVNLRTLATRYAAYGDFGFYDALNPRTGAVAYNYLALDQSMIFIALANYLRHGVIQKYFAADPIMQRVLPLLRAERFACAQADGNH